VFSFQGVLYPERDETMTANRKNTGNLNPPKNREKGDLQKALAAIEGFSVPGIPEREDAWIRLIEKTGNPVKKSKIHPEATRFLYRVAAVAATLIIAVLGYWFQTNEIFITKESLYGEHNHLVLPDGSKVTLNSGTKISYKKFGWKKERLIHLEGEAFFEVTGGETFKVVTKEAEVTVLGTSFNVYARNNEVKVSCFSGRVGVKTTSGEDVILLPGHSAKAENSRIIHLNTDKNLNDNGWLKGEFFYQNQPLETVLKEIERQFNVNIAYKDSIRRSYTGYFNNSDLRAALDMVLIPMQLKAKIIPDNIIEVYDAN
jgi:transmembrane sensor